MVVGELSDALLDQLSALSSEVFLPLIAGGRAPPLAAMPEVMAKGVAEGMHKFVASGGSWLLGWGLGTLPSGLAVLARA